MVEVAKFGVFLTFLISWGLSRSVLHGDVSTFSLELPSYRPPRIWVTICTFIIDRSIIVLWRAVHFALSAGAVIWLIANVMISGVTIAEYLINFLNPAGLLLGMNRIILLAYIVAIPANEIVIPDVLMLTVLISPLGDVAAGAGVIFEANSAQATSTILTAGGWTLLTAVCVMLFNLIHNPCSTTIYTIYKETGSKRWTAVASLLPPSLGLLVIFTVAQLWRMLASLF